MKRIESSVTGEVTGESTFSRPRYAWKISYCARRCKQMLLAENNF